MTISASTLRKLVDAGVTGDMLVSVVEIMEAESEGRRAKARDKKRRQRELSRGQIGTERDSEGTNGDTVSPKERSPLHPPKEITPSTLSEPNGSSSEPRAGTTSEPMARLEFDSEFWPLYPNKVGKPRALEAFIAARRKATLPEILDGLARYKSDKPPDRQWLNPATFLNQERWNDEPAAVTARQPGSKPEPPHDALFRALAEAAVAGDGGGGWPADDDGRMLDYRA